VASDSDAKMPKSVIFILLLLLRHTIFQLTYQDLLSVSTQA